MKLQLDENHNNIQSEMLYSIYVFAMGSDFRKDFEELELTPTNIRKIVFNAKEKYENSDNEFFGKKVKLNQGVLLKVIIHVFMAYGKS